MPTAREPAPPPADADPAAQRTAPGSGIRGTWAVVEDVWLGRTTPTLGERMTAAGWAPDSPGEYCPRCGTIAGPYAADDTGCGWCRSRDLAWDRTVRLGDYAGLLRDLVLEVKFTRWRRLGAELGRMLGVSLDRALRASEADRRRVAIVPVPMSFRRRMAMGIDHTLVIARAAAGVAGVPVVRALARRHGPTQLDVPPSERARNANRALRARWGVRVPWREGPWIVILLDDVRTTGATLTAAARALRSTCTPEPRTTTACKSQVLIWTAVVAVTAERVSRRGQEPDRIP